MMRIFLLSILMAISYASWDSHCDAVEAMAGDSFVGCMIVGQTGIRYTTDGGTGDLYLNNFADFQAVVGTVLNKNHMALMYDTAKFLCVQQTDDFSVFTYSGDYHGIKKPIMIIAPTKTAVVVGLFSKRDSNVDHVCRIAGNLAANNVLAAATETDAEVGASGVTGSSSLNVVVGGALAMLAFYGGYSYAQQTKE